MLSNACLHEAIDTIIQYIKSNKNKAIVFKKERVHTLIEKICISIEISKTIIKEDINIKSEKKENDTIEEMTIVELTLMNRIREIKNNLNIDIENIINETEAKIINGIKEPSIINTGSLIKEGKLLEKHLELRNILSSMKKEQAKIYDLFSNY